MIYLDSGATTLQKPPAVSLAVAGAIKKMASPGRGGHRPAQMAADVVYRCRKEAAELFDVPSPDQVVFTSNATHGLNIAIHSLVQPGDTVLISGYEHNAVTRPLHSISGVTIKTVSTPLFLPKQFLEEFKRKLTQEVKCVIMTHVSNVFGYILPIEEIAALCRDKGIPFIVDASQSAGCLPVTLRRWGAAFVAMPGHKGLYGPQGTGILLCGERGEPFMQGGTGSASRRQEMPEYLPDRLEAGTHNVCGIAGLLEGLRYVRGQGVNQILNHERMLTQKTGEMLSRVPGVLLFRAEDPRVQTGVLSFVAEQMDCEILAEALAERGVAVRAGLHCAPFAHLTAGTAKSGTVRVSFSNLNTLGEVKKFTEILARILKET